MFTVTEILFFLLGVLSTLVVIGLVVLARRYTLRWYSIGLAALGGLLAIFAIAWVTSSLMEGETRAAYVGLIVFGTPVLILLGLTRQLVARDSAPIQS
ncbi:MAG: dehalogenase [Chloroflexota bacterium]